MENIINTIPLEDSVDSVSAAEAKRAIEAILFAAGHPVTYEKIGAVLTMTPGTVKRLVQEFADEYNDPASPLPRGVLLLTFTDSCQLCTKEQYGQTIRDALGIRRGGNLSASSIEVLAIVAYNEPVTRAYIDTVRGVDSSYGVNSLCEKHLIEPCGRLDVPGRPLLYRTTPDFLRVFGISSLSELPEITLPKSAEAATENVLPLEESQEEPTNDDSTDNAENI